MRPMNENQTTKLKGSRLTAWQARGLSTANWNALRLVLLCVFVLSKGPQYLRVYPPSVCLALLLPRSRVISPSLSDL